MEKLTSPDKKSAASQRHSGSAVPIVAAGVGPVRVERNLTATHTATILPGPYNPRGPYNPEVEAQNSMGIGTFTLVLIGAIVAELIIEARRARD